MKKYLYVYSKILGIHIKTMLEYRFNLVINSLYVLIYFVGLFTLIEIVYTKTDHLMSFSKPELHILFGLSTLYSTLMSFFYFDGFKYFMMADVKTGQFDFVLLKPINPQFLVATSHPLVESGFQILLALSYASWLIWQHSPQLNVLQFFSFCLTWLIANVIIYNVIATHATTAFFTTQSVQLLRLSQSLNDHSQFPTSLYTRPMQLVLTILFPIAFMAYIPGLFLFGKANWVTVIGLLAALLFSTVANIASWRYGLRHYSSASS